MHTNTNTNTITKHWAMLAVDYDKVMDIMYPLYAQPKLNGVRAMWCPVQKKLISRQGKIIHEHVLPHIYSKHKDTSVRLDGELYCPNMRFQEIAGLVNGSRLDATPESYRIQLHVFDIVSDLSTSRRLEMIKEFSPHVKATLLHSYLDLNGALTAAVQQGYEGLMLRSTYTPYIAGRTVTLIKLKPLHHMTVRVVGFIEGLGKFAGALGALVVENNGQQFKVGGGQITTEERKEIWKNKTKYLNSQMTIAYRELSKKGIPLQSQLTRI